MACTMYLVLGCIGMISCGAWELDVDTLQGWRNVCIMIDYYKLD